MSDDATKAGPIPTPEQAATWGEDYLWMWCQGYPKDAAAEIERLRAALWTMIETFAAGNETLYAVEKARAVLSEKR